MSRAYSSRFILGKFIFGSIAILCVALSAGKLGLVWQTASATALHASAAPDTPAKPALGPAVYHHVSQIIWVVKDVDRVSDYWQRLGIHNIQSDGVVSFPDMTYRGKKIPRVQNR